LKNKHTFLKKPQKVAKLRKAKFPPFEGTRGDKNQIFRTLVCCHLVNLMSFTEQLFFSQLDINHMIQEPTEQSKTHVDHPCKLILFKVTFFSFLQQHAFLPVKKS
jgi:hypothetical protein